MKDRIAQTAAQALHWFAKGSYGGIMPVREKLSAGTAKGQIIGARKATIWDGIKVAFYSSEKRAQLERSKGDAITYLWHKQQTESSASLVSTKAERILLGGKVLIPLLKKGAFPTNRETGTALQTPFDRLKVKYCAPNKRFFLSEAQQNFKSYKSLKEPLAKWVYNPSSDTPTTRQELSSVLISRTGRSYNDFRFEGKTKLELSGWVPKRERITQLDKENPAHKNVFDMEGKFSSIATSKEELIPTSFPQTFTQYFDHYDKTGTVAGLTRPNADGEQEPVKPRQWTLVPRDADDLKNNTARYTSPNVDDLDAPEDIRAVSLPEIARMPKNLILEHTNGEYAGYTTVWQVIPCKDEKSGKFTGRWIKTLYDPKGEACAPLLLNRDGTYSHDGSGRAMAHYGVMCDSPFLFFSKADRQAAKAQEPERKTRFVDTATRVTFSADAPAKYLNHEPQIFQTQHTEHGVITSEPVKESDVKTMAPNYESKYKGVLEKAAKLKQERVEELLEQKLDLASDYDPIAAPLEIERHSADVKKLRKVLADRHSFHVAKQNPFRAKQSWQLQIDRDVMDGLKKRLTPELKYRAGSGANAHEFVPTIYQHSQWKEQAKEQFSKVAVAKQLEKLINTLVADGAGQANHPAAKELKRLLGDSGTLVTYQSITGKWEVDLDSFAGNAEQFEHARLLLICDAIAKLTNEQKNTRELLDGNMAALESLETKDISLEPDALGKLSTDAKNYKTIYRNITTLHAQVDNALTHADILGELYKSSFNHYAKLTLLRQNQGTTSAHIEGRKDQIRNYEADHGRTDLYSFNGIATQFATDAPYVDQVVGPAITRMEEKISGISFEEVSDTGSENSFDQEVEDDGAQNFVDSASHQYTPAPTMPAPPEPQSEFEDDENIYVDPFEQPGYSNIANGDAQEHYDVPRGSRSTLALAQHHGYEELDVLGEETRTNTLPRVKVSLPPAPPPPLPPKGEEVVDAVVDAAPEPLYAPVLKGLERQNAVRERRRDLHAQAAQRRLEEVQNKADELGIEIVQGNLEDAIYDQVGVDESDTALPPPLPLPLSRASSVVSLERLSDVSEPNEESLLEWAQNYAKAEKSDSKSESITSILTS